MADLYFEPARCPQCGGAGELTFTDCPECRHPEAREMPGVYDFMKYCCNMKQATE